MEPIGATIIANPNYEFFQNTIDWYDTSKTYCKTLLEDFLAEYVYTATELEDGIPLGEYVFYVFHKNDKSHTPYSSFSIESEYFKEMMAGDNKKFIVNCKKETFSHFPHTCTLCKQPAYIGGLNNCECSNSNCSLFQ